jgi:hypothetical protein
LQFEVVTVLPVKEIAGKPIEYPEIRLSTFVLTTVPPLLVAAELQYAAPPPEPP